MLNKYINSLKKGLSKYLNNLDNYKKELSKNNKKKWTLISVLVILVLGIFAYANMGLFVAATVNGQPITRIKLIRRLEKQGGSQVLDSIITETLIQQEAKNKNIAVTQEDIKLQLDEITKSLEAQGSDLDTALAMQGQTKDDLTESLKLRIMAEKLLSERITIGDDEVKAYYDENKETYPAGSKFEDLKPQILDTLKQQKLSTEYQNWIAEVKQSAKINTLLTF